MKDFFALKVVDLFKGLYKKLGVDYNIMRLIVQSKLVMDSRKIGNTSNVREEDVKEKNYFYSSLIVYGIIGIISIPIILLDVNPIIKMSLYFGFFMIMILTSFISDFSGVILDINDKDIIGTKGVDLNTLNAAKITHIFIYIFMLSLSISVFSLITSLRYGIGFFILFLISIFLIDIFMIIVTAGMYFIIIKLFSGEKLKDMLNIFQIFFLLAFTVVYQVLAQSFQFIDLQIVYEPHWWNILIPPMWFASNFSMLKGIEPSIITIILSILSIVVPIISIVVYVKSVSTFESDLQKLNNNIYNNKKTKENLSSKFSKIICRNTEERVFFNFVNNVLGKDREFKTKIYPSLAMAVFMPFLIMITSYDGEGLWNYLESLKGSSVFLSAYLGVAISQNVINMIQYSTEHEASWIYEVVPIKDISSVYSGMFKAVMYKLVLGAFSIIALGFLLIFRIGVLKHLVVIFLANIIVAMFTIRINEKNLPFSLEYKTASATSDIGVVFKSMFIVGILAMIHFVVNKSTIFTLMYAFVLVLLIHLNWNKTFEVN